MNFTYTLPLGTLGYNLGYNCNNLITTGTASTLFPSYNLVNIGPTIPSYYTLSSTGTTFESPRSDEEPDFDDMVEQMEQLKLSMKRMKKKYRNAMKSYQDLMDTMSSPQKQEPEKVPVLPPLASSLPVEKTNAANVQGSDVTIEDCSDSDD